MLFFYRLFSYVLKQTSVSVATAIVIATATVTTIASTTIAVLW